MEMVAFMFLSGVVSPLFLLALKGAVHLFAVVLEVAEESHVSALDRYLAETGWCSARDLGPGQLPADGVHFGFLRGPFLAQKVSAASPRGGYTTSYRVYAPLQCTVRALRAKLLGDPRNIACTYFHSPAPWRTSAVTLYCVPPAAAYAWQAGAVVKIMQQFRRKNRASALVCGPSGVGKSTLAELVALAIKEELKTNPQVIYGLTPTAKGVLPQDAYHTPSPTAQIILVLDEFDGPIDHAEEGRAKSDKREGSSLADDPATLLTALDQWGRTLHLVVIATTNKTLETMVAGAYERYTRKGRLDVHIEVERFACPEARED